MRLSNKDNILENKKNGLKHRNINKLKENINIKEKNGNKNKSNYSKDELKNLEVLSDFLNINSPKILEQIEISEYLGSGGESNVYKAKTKNTKQTCLLKIIINQNRNNKNLNELKNSRKLKHNNIINYLTNFPIIKNNTDSILMEFCLHGNLCNFLYNTLKRNYFSESFLCYITINVLKALKHCQINKIVHYDIKPDNIVINEYLNIKLIDFSESVDYSGYTKEKIKLKFSGTGFYMAPEVIKEMVINLKDINKIDLYSLGILIYRFAYGYFPYSLNYEEDKKNYDNIYNKIMNNNVEFEKGNKDYSGLFKDFVKKLLEKDINKRISINESLEHPWVKASSILFDEKEKLYNMSNFLIELMLDNFYNFNKFLGK